MNAFIRASALTLGLLFLALCSANAQVKLGFVNTETIVQQMPEFKDIDAKLKTLQSAYQDTLRAMEINFKTRSEAYQKQQSMMTADARAKEEEQLRGIAEQYQQYQQDRFGPQGVLAQRQAELIQPIREKVRAAIEKVAKDEKLSAVIFDIDHFKRVNDTYGHDIGDEVIRVVARAAMGEVEALGRIGGEEFAFLLRGRGIAEAAALAERLRENFARLQINAAGTPVMFTCSFGVSAWETGDSLDGLLKRADIALYKAKTGGRDRVIKNETPWAAEDDDPPRCSGIIRFATR